MALFTLADAIKFRDNCLVITAEEQAMKYMMATPSVSWVKDCLLAKIKEAPKKKQFELELYVWQKFDKHMPEEIKTAFQEKINEKYQAAFPDCEIYYVDGTDLATYFMIKLNMEPKIAYQYTVSFPTGEQARKSALYNTFDEMYEAVNKELTELHNSVGLNWNDPEIQKTSRKDWDWSVSHVDCKLALDKFPSIQFADLVNCGRTERFYLEKVYA